MNILRNEERGDNYYESIVSLPEALDEMAENGRFDRESIVSEISRLDDVVVNGITYRKIHGGGK